MSLDVEIDEEGTTMKDFIQEEESEEYLHELTGKKADPKQLKVKPPVDGGKTPQERIIEQHVFYPAALWIEKHIETAEEAYLRKTAKRHGLTVLQTILDHMLGYFSIRDSELGKALKDSKKNTHNNELQN